MEKMVLGKSTIAKLISGIEKPNKGQVLIDNISTSNKKSFLDIRKKVGIVFQNPENQILFNNVYDDIVFAMSNLGVENKKENIKSALQKTGMDEYVNSETYELSLGQKQRITISGVIALNPKYIVLDEPTAMLDPEGKEKVYEIVRNLKSQGYTIIYITNLIDEILITDKAIVLEDGRIIKTFMKKDILEQIEFLKEHEIKIPDMVKIVYELKNKGVNLKIENWDKEEIINKIVNVHCIHTNKVNNVGVDVPGDLQKENL